MTELSGKVALVTGSGKGIGRGIALGLAKCGAKVVVNYNSNKIKACQTAEDIRRMGASALLVGADVSNEADIKRMFSEIAVHYGKLDILVNNAATQPNESFAAYSEDQLKNVFYVNLRGYLLCIKYAAEYMKASGSGSIVNISSIHAKRPTGFDVGYSMTKGAIKMLTREAAIELDRYKINVNAVEPGYIEIGEKSGDSKTIITAEMENAKPLFDYMRWYKYRAVGLPEDVAPIVCFLVSDENRIITGTSVRVDGCGMLL